jgi:hypothetical protein
MLEAYTSDPSIKTDDRNITIYGIIGGKFTSTKTEIFL